MTVRMTEVEKFLLERDRMPEEMYAHSLQWLEDNPDGHLDDRIAAAVVVACEGDLVGAVERYGGGVLGVPNHPLTARAAELASCTEEEVRYSLRQMEERGTIIEGARPADSLVPMIVGQRRIALFYPDLPKVADALDQGGNVRIQERGD